MTNRCINFCFILILIFACAGLTSCAAKTTPTPNINFSAWLASATPSSIQPQATSTIPATEEIKKVLYLKGGSATNDTEIEQILQTLTQETGYLFEKVDSINEENLKSNVILVVINNTDESINQWITTKPETKFLFIGDSSLAESPNLFQLKVNSLKTEKLDFFAGYIAAIISENWRVGLIDTGETNTVEAFSKGFRFYCGLCRPSYPPFVQYPIIVQVSSDKDDGQTAAAKFVENGVETVYLADSSENSMLIQTLAEKKIRLIGTSAPAEAVKSLWVVTLYNPDPRQIIKDNLPQWLKNSSEVKPLKANPFKNVNSEFFSLGRQKLAEKCYNDLMDGIIDALE